MCLVRSWDAGLEAIYMVAWLSKKNNAGCETSTRKSWSNYLILRTVKAKAQYSTSEEDLQTVACILAL